MSDFPNTNDPAVARLFIAWNFSTEYRASGGSDMSNMQNRLRVFARAYHALNHITSHFSDWEANMPSMLSRLEEILTADEEPPRG